MLGGENMRFRSVIFILFVFAQLFKCHKNGNIRKPGLSNCKKMSSVDYIMNALEHSKVRLPFFDTLCICMFGTNILMFSGSGFCSSRQILLVVMLFHVAKDPMLFLFFKSTLLYHFMQLLQITTISLETKKRNTCVFYKNSFAVNQFKF